MVHLVIGASTNPYRYSNIAVRRLLSRDLIVRAIGKSEGDIDGVKIQSGKPDFENVDTVLMYINPSHQPEYYDYILKLQPRRIIFNPGSENPTFEHMAKEQGIEPIEACSLVMMSVGAY